MDFLVSSSSQTERGRRERKPARRGKRVKHSTEKKSCTKLSCHDLSQCVFTMQSTCVYQKYPKKEEKKKGKEPPSLSPRGRGSKNQSF